MVLAILMFILGVGGVMGGYWAYAHLPAYMERRRLNQRLQDLSAPAAAEGEESLVRKAASGPLPVFDKMMEGSKAGYGLTRLIDQSGVQTTPSAVLVMCLGSGLFGALVTSVFVQLPFAPLVVMVVGAALPIGYLLFRKSRRMAKFEEQFPEALDLLSRALRAGHAFQTAMGMVADDMKEPVGPEFQDPTAASPAWCCSACPPAWA
jgi:tight adherence protein B